MATLHDIECIFFVVIVIRNSFAGSQWPSTLFDDLLNKHFVELLHLCLFKVRTVFKVRLHRLSLEAMRGWGVGSLTPPSIFLALIFAA